MTGRRGKSWVSVAAAAATVAAMSIGSAGHPAVEAAPGDDAFDVPGLVALNVGGDAVVDVVSCSSAGNCSSGGYYRDSTADDQAFLISQRDGVGSAAAPVPGLAALDLGKDSDVTGLSCPADGVCSAGGGYEDGNGDDQAFLVSQLEGVWGEAAPVPGLEAMNTSGNADVADLSCGAPGDCVAAGKYRTADGDHAYVVTQVDGEWGDATDIPGLSALDQEDNSDVRAVSCVSRGHCTVVGSYEDGAGDGQVFVVSLIDGEWGSAMQLPGLDTLNVGGDAEIYSMSCTAPGDCSAAGYYTDASDDGQGLVASQLDGVWEAATPVPGLEALNVGGYTIFNSVSCTAPGYCSAGGYYSDADGDQGFVVTQTAGAWGLAAPVPGLKALNTNGGADLEVVECVSPGNCVAGGYFEDIDLSYFAFYAVQTDGVWSDAIRIPGLPTLAADNDAELHAISCASDGTCLGGGYYTAESDPGNIDHGYLFEFPIIPGGTLQPVPPARLVESRPGEETADGESEGFGRVAAGSATRFVVAGRGGVPEGADAAMLNVTAVFPEADGFLTVWSCEGDVPLASSVNYFAGGVFPNAVLVELNDDGEACVYSLAATDLIVDLNGFVPIGGSPGSVAPFRLVESRPGEVTDDGESEGFGQIDADSVVRFDVAGRGAVPDDADAAMLNVTAVFPEADGFLTVWSCDGDVPVASSVNYFAGGVFPNAVLVELNDDGEACVYSLAATDLIVDVNSYVPVAAAPAPVLPARLVESRPGEETADGESEGFGRVAAGSATRFVVAGRGGVPEGADAAMLNVTAVFPEADGFLTVWSCEGDVPLASSVNYFAGGVFPNAVLVELNDDGEACVYSLAATDLIVDLNAYTD